MKTTINTQRIAIVLLLVGFFAGISGTAVSQPKKDKSDLQVALDVKDETCYHSNDVQITITATGGSGNYTYSVDGGNQYSTNPVFKNLMGGTTYAIVVRDSDGNTKSVWQPVSAVWNPITLRIDDISDASCSSPNGGYIKSGASGGNGSITFSIDGGLTFQNDGKFRNLANGSYSIIARDKNGCLSEIKTAIVHGSFTAMFSGDSTVAANNIADIILTINDETANAKDIYNITYQDSHGKTFNLNNLKVGKNIIPVEITDEITFTLKSIKKGQCNGFAAGSAHFQISDEFIWLGKNNDWSDGQNWSGKTVPSLSDNIRIPHSQNEPVITTIANANQIVMEEGATLKIAGVLKLSGDISGAGPGAVNAAKGTIYYCGIEGQTINSRIFKDLAIKDLFVGNEVYLNDSLNVFGSITFPGDNHTFHTNDYLTLKSTPVQTASVGKLEHGNKITGKVTVEQYFPARKGWKFLSVSTQPGQSIHDAWQEGQEAGNTTGIVGYGMQLTGQMKDWAQKGFDRQSNAPSIKFYNIETGLWKGIESTLEPFNNPTNGYMVFLRGDRSAHLVESPETPTILRSKGELKFGDQEIVTIPAGKFVAIGNPFPSDIDMTKIKTSGNMFFYVWDPALGDSYGAYQTFMRVDKEHFTAVPGGGTYNTLSQNTIGAGQAFFVFNEDGGTVQLTEESKVSVANPVNSSRKMTGGLDDINERLNLKLYKVNSSGASTLVDGILQNLNTDFSKEIDGYDAIKSANSAENLSMKRNGKLLSIESKSLNEGNDTTLLNLTGVSYSSYRFQMKYEQADEKRMAILVDKYTNKQTAIVPNQQITYDFQVENIKSSYAPDRFEIIFSPLRAMPVTFKSVKAEKKQDRVQVKWTIVDEINVSNYIVERSVDGKIFSQIGSVVSDGKSEYQFTDVKPFNGLNYYRIVSVDIDGKRGYTQIVSVNNILSADVVKVYPNPIAGNDIKVEVRVQVEGLYYFSVRNQMGQLIDTRREELNNATNNLLFQPDKKLSNGVYTVEITYPDGGHLTVNFIK